MHDTTATADRRTEPGRVDTTTSVLELRQYELHPGQRETLIDLFDREFVEPQEAVGMRILGQFRDLDDPDRFVWLRGFPDMSARTEALAAFYGGPVWATHRDAANATMIDSDNVLLLRPASGGWNLPRLAGERPPPGTRGDGPGVVAATILHLDLRAQPDAFARLFKSEALPRITGAGTNIVGNFVTEESPNTFPRLPVREGERVWVIFARYPDVAALERGRAILDADPVWRERVQAQLRPFLLRKPEVLRLKPTARSLLHG